MSRNKKAILPVFVLFFMFFSISIAFSGDSKYACDFSDPKSVVAAAAKMVQDSDYHEMLKITEMSEKKRAQEIVNSLLSNEVTKDDLKQEAEKILGFEILGVEFVTNGNENKLAVVKTKWLMKAETILPKPHANPRDFTPMDASNNSEPKRTARTTTVVFVDYLLKQYGGQWKIVSKRSR